MAAHSGDAGAQVELSIVVLDVALALGTHDVVGEIGHTGSRRCTHDSGDTGVVGRRPSDGPEVKPRILRRAVITETANTDVEIECGSRANRVVVGGRDCVGKIGFCTPIHA